MVRNLFFAFFIFCFTSLFAADYAVITVQSQDRYDLAFENKKTYCAQHDYDLFYTQSEEDKNNIILKVLEQPKYKWILWMDEDTLIMNLDVPIQDLIDEHYHLIFSKDHAGMNSEVFLAKNSTLTKHVLSSSDLVETFEGKIYKIVPQRIFNSYPMEYFFLNRMNMGLQEEYQVGDFILNLKGYDGVHQYAEQVVSDSNLITLDAYLGYYGFKLSPAHTQNNEGYMSDAQKEQFAQKLLSYPHVKRIAEIGLNGGHSAENFFNSCRVEKFLSFDLNIHPYTKVAVEYFSRKYKNGFEFVAGDSQKTVPSYTKKFRDQKFDLIYIDGSHVYLNCLNDIKNCQKLAHRGTILWIDDFHEGNEVQKATLESQKKGIIKITGVYEAWDHTGLRRWAEAVYN